MKSINPQKKKKKKKGNVQVMMALKQYFTILLNVYDSWGKLRTINGTSRTGIISAIYKKSNKRDIENYRPISTYTLYYNS